MLLSSSTTSLGPVPTGSTESSASGSPLMVSAPSFLQHNKPSKPSWLPGTQEASSNVSSAAIGIGITMIVLGLPVTYVGYRFLRWGLSKI